MFELRHSIRFIVRWCSSCDPRSDSLFDSFDSIQYSIDWIGFVWRRDQFSSLQMPNRRVVGIIEVTKPHSTCHIVIMALWWCFDVSNRCVHYGIYTYTVCVIVMTQRWLFVGIYVIHLLLTILAVFSLILSFKLCQNYMLGLWSHILHQLMTVDK